jgi:hypothetical protein
MVNSPIIISNGRMRSWDENRVHEQDSIQISSKHTHFHKKDTAIKRILERLRNIVNGNQD